MRIAHESMPEEAEEISFQLGKVYGFKNEIVQKDLSSLFPSIPEFGGFRIADELYLSFNDLTKRKTLVLTPRDLFAANKSKEDDWIFGSCAGNLMIASSARMKGKNSLPTIQL